MENSAIKLTVYGKPGCVQCTATERYLAGKGREFEKIDITTDEEAYKRVEELGYLQVPVVVAEDGEHWYGFVPDRLAVYA